MFELFNDNARALVKLAEKEARELHHNYIGTEHFVLAMTRLDQPALKEFFTDFPVNSEDFEQGIVDTIGKGGSAPVGNVPLTARMQSIIRTTTRLARENRENVTPIALLLNIIEEGQGVGATLLQRFDVSYESVSNMATKLRRMPILVAVDPFGHHRFEPDSPGYDDARRLVIKREAAKAKLEEIEAQMRRLGLKYIT